MEDQESRNGRMAERHVGVRLPTKVVEIHRNRSLTETRPKAGPGEVLILLQTKGKPTFFPSSARPIGPRRTAGMILFSRNRPRL
jgi:hypothetical protein